MRTFQPVARGPDAMLPRCAQTRPDVYTVTSCTARNWLSRANRQRMRLCNSLTSLIPHRSHQEFFCNPHLLLTTDLSQIYQGYIRQYDTPRTKATYLYATWLFQISRRSETGCSIPAMNPIWCTKERLFPRARAKKQSVAISSSKSVLKKIVRSNRRLIPQ